ILLTAGHSVQAGDALGARLVSIDLSILGAEPDRYDAYAAAIRHEYAHVPEPLYRAGRAAIMGRFLESPRLFADPLWAERYEDAARANLRREITALTA
ncbi:MAG: phosphohydrolase, partial [Brevundimonas sp.]|nr:phosphohydrolase [Brevundimonas sp.]